MAYLQLKNNFSLCMYNKLLHLIVDNQIVLVYRKIVEKHTNTPNILTLRHTNTLPSKSIENRVSKSIKAHDWVNSY
jgi:hypothetical protein